MPSSNYTVQLPVFAGPLDLLLQLIEREELDITKVSLAQVTDQFLAYIKVLENLAIADLAEFLAIAARLILIKSEALLPRPVERQPGEEDPGDELARQLMAYKKYKQIAGMLKEREEANLRTYLRLAPPPKVEKKLDFSKLTTLDLLEAVRRALALMPDKPSLGSVVAPPKVTIREQIQLIAHSLRAEWPGQLSTTASDRHQPPRNCGHLPGCAGAYQTPQDRGPAGGNVRGN
jgi:segregation and condensation protein A